MAPSSVAIALLGSGTQSLTAPSGPSQTGIFTGVLAPTGLGDFTFRVVASGNYGAASADYVVTTRQYAYFGSRASGDYNAAFIGTLSRSGVASGHGQIFATTGTAAQYTYYAFRAAAGAPSFIDNASRLGGGFALVGSGISFTNGAGFAESYNLWGSDQSGLGNLSLTVTGAPNVY